MKKAKIMLAGVAVLAVVGGALAFKAKTYIAHLYCTPNAFVGRTSLISTSFWTPELDGAKQLCNTTTYFNVATTQVEITTVAAE